MSGVPAAPTEHLGSATFVDHLVVAAADLDQADAWCRATLGVAPTGGGQHPLMGTHNRLLAIGSEAFPRAYLELIAIDPAAAPPQGRARWFGLDDPALQQRLRDEGPRLVHVVARSGMLDMHRWGLITVGLPPGDPVAAHRDTPSGRLEWQILLKPDGQLLCGGALPTLIQWRGGHPADAMPASGVVLKSLRLHGIPPRARQVLRLRGVQHSETAAPALEAVLDTPQGEVVLRA